MIIFWKGWGLSVMLLTILCFFVVIGTFIAIDSAYPDSLYTPDKAKAAADAWRLIALCFFLSAASVFLASRYRIRKMQEAVDASTDEAPAVFPRDEFMFISLRHWPLILAAASLGTLVWSFFPQSGT